MAQPVNKQVLRIAVASDLHAFVRDKIKGAERPHLIVDSNTDGAGENPVEGIKELIRVQGLEADVLVSPGDLGNQADPTAIEYAWKALHEIAGALNARLCVAASGNHDIDSRLQYHSFDPLETLKKLKPSYPVADPVERFRYWSQHFSIVELEGLRIVILNSAAFHWLQPEWERGRVSPITLSWLEQELRNRGETKPINILLCHHHPHRHPELKTRNSSFDVMVDGNQLIELLGKGEHGQWLIIHGHKHHPFLSYSAGSSQSPTVFSAGSFSGPLYPELQSLARNQFYIVEIPLDAIKSLGLVGRIRSWVWAYQNGWIAPEGNSGGLPKECSFGCRESPITLAGHIDRVLAGTSYMEWREIAKTYPALDFLLTADYVGLKSALGSRHNILIEETSDGRPAQIGRS